MNAHVSNLKLNNPATQRSIYVLINVCGIYYHIIGPSARFDLLFSA